MSDLAESSKVECRVHQVVVELGWTEKVGDCKDVGLAGYFEIDLKNTRDDDANRG